MALKQINNKFQQLNVSAHGSTRHTGDVQAIPHGVAWQ